MFCMLPVLHNVSLALYQVHSIDVLCLHSMCMMHKHHSTTLAQPRCSAQHAPGAQCFSHASKCTRQLQLQCMMSNCFCSPEAWCKCAEQAGQASETLSNTVNLHNLRETSHKMKQRNLIVRISSKAHMRQNQPTCRILKRGLLTPPGRPTTCSDKRQRVHTGRRS